MASVALARSRPRLGLDQYAKEPVFVQTACPKCDLDIAVFSGYVSVFRPAAAPAFTHRPEHGRVYYLQLGKDRPGRPGRLTGRGKSFLSNETPGQPAQHWTLVCPGRHCGFRYRLPRRKLAPAMVRVWNGASHRLIAGRDV